MVRKMLLSWIVALTLLHATLTHGQEISVNNGGGWGDWGWMDTCPSGTVATGFELKVEKPQGNGDDTALNAIKLLCTRPGDRYVQAQIMSKQGGWGNWNGYQWCPSGYLISFALQVEGSQGDGDDTAANNIMFQCSDNNILTGYGGGWGTFGSWSGKCHSGICGIRTKVERDQGKGDDTAMNDVVFRCC
ncbi:vitelline membrane outer layer protein 1-like [Rana temporaria]|uniref:vitelline membrane outer layer protein 1-like n=1 Tax=Rana temporaria TaxID=8407 RepID=UPI001AADCBA9|nr:vitelline membrane outer layer protein 1-like [Rana temporaria]